MKILNIEENSNKLMLFGGVYSNLQALESLKVLAQEKGFLPSQIICNGDIIGYCSQPEECLQLIKNWGIHCIVGNVEEQMKNGEEDCGCDFAEGGRCDTFSRQWYPYAKARISPDSLRWLKGLPDYITFKMAGRKGIVVHGAYSYISKFIFESTAWEEKEKEFKKSKANIIVAGHSGIPFSESRGDKTWINPGVIGMPANDGNTAVWYAVLSTMEGQVRVSHYSFDYNKELANHLMVKNKLPGEYAETLLSGIWDNCEILPEKETNQQGKTIKFGTGILQ